jgi:hypothetical protein
LTVFANPTFTADFQGLCNKIADTLNRQDMTAVIPDFVTLATARIQRDMARVKHPFMINRAQASVIDNYVPMPTDFVSVYQLMDQNTSNAITYITPDQSMTVQSLGWNPDQSPLPIIPPYYSPIGNQTYYTIVGNRLRIIPAPGQEAPELLDLWYYARLNPLNNQTTTNWALSRYPDLYLYGSLVHTAPYLKADERIPVWDSAYQTILKDIEVEADRATRPQSKLVAARRSF